MAATVLVVEDERKLRDLVRSYLERAGFTVLTTDSGAEAITMAMTSAPDLVILDLGLPDVPGETVASELRATSATPPGSRWDPKSIFFGIFERPRSPGAGRPCQVSCKDHYAAIPHLRTDTDPGRRSGRTDSSA